MILLKLRILCAMIEHLNFSVKRQKEREHFRKLYVLLKSLGKTYCV